MAIDPKSVRSVRWVKTSCPEDGGKCPSCLEALDGSKRVVAHILSNPGIEANPKLHHHHLSCIQSWFEANRAMDHMPCPICRAPTTDIPLRWPDKLRNICHIQWSKINDYSKAMIKISVLAPCLTISMTVFVFIVVQPSLFCTFGLRATLSFIYTKQLPFLYTLSYQLVTQTPIATLASLAYGNCSRYAFNILLKSEKLAQNTTVQAITYLAATILNIYIAQYFINIFNYMPINIDTFKSLVIPPMVMSILTNFSYGYTLKKLDERGGPINPFREDRVDNAFNLLDQSLNRVLSF